MLRAEARLAGRFIDRGRDGALDGSSRRQIFDASAVGADEMMVMLGEALGELVPREVVRRHDAVNDTHFLEHDEVAIHRALCEAVAATENFRES